MDVSGFLSLAFRNIFELQYVISPILLKNGIAENQQYKTMHIAQLTQQGLIPFTRDGFFAHFKVVGGGSLMQNTVAAYPVANMATAGNAVVQQPTAVSVQMYCPANASYTTNIRGIILKNLIDQLNLHIRKGGLFVVYTPMFVFDNCLLVGIRDASEGSVPELQNSLIFDFQKPMIMTLDDVEGAKNDAMGKIGKGEKF